MWSSKKVLGLVALVLGAGVASAGQTPFTVSPGDPGELLLVEARCPTFSWAAVDDAEKYELVVYEIGEAGEKAEPVIQHTLPGAVSAWTPSLDRCLARTGRYAWSVRAAGPKGLTEWSAASLFGVAAAPSEISLDQALEVVREQLAAEAVRLGLSQGANRQQREGGTVAAPGDGGALVTRAAAAEVDFLVTDGDIAVTSANAAAQHAYIQLDTVINYDPSDQDCNEASEVGRLLYRWDTNRLYVCDDAGWRTII